MKILRSEKLSQHLLNVDEEILAKAYEVDTSEKLQEYIQRKNVKNKKPFYVSPIFRRATVFAACLLLVVGVALYVPALFSPATGDSPLILLDSNDDNSKPNRTPYIVADNDDTYGLELEDLKSRDEKYISPSLLEKMQTYHGTNAVYRVIVEILITAEDYDEFTVTDEELLMLEEQENEAFEAYEKALASLKGVSDESERAVIVNEINEKEKIARDLQRKCDECREKLNAEYCENIVNARLEYASNRSKTAPILISDESDVLIYAAYKQQAYFMDLTAKDINDLAEKGGYLLRLASSSEESVPYPEKE